LPDRRTVLLSISPVRATNHDEELADAEQGPGNGDRGIGDAWRYQFQLGHGRPGGGRERPAA
jgi:hypothetical protein